MKRITLTGSECTGKTTLATALATCLGTIAVPEYARRFVALKGSPPQASDVDAMARGQMDLEDRRAAAGGPFLILDTDLLSTVVYSTHYFDICPPWIDVELERRHADLYLLCGIDVPWVADGDQRDRGHRREEMQDLFRQALQLRRLDWAEISGSPEQRQRAAASAIDRLLAG